MNRLLSSTLPIPHPPEEIPTSCNDHSTKARLLHFANNAHHTLGPSGFIAPPFPTHTHIQSQLHQNYPSSNIPDL